MKLCSHKKDMSGYLRSILASITGCGDPPSDVAMQYHGYLLSKVASKYSVTRYPQLYM